MFSDKLKKAIKERDGNECQLSKLFGISELTGVPCSKILTIHHKTYIRAMSNNELTKDGITVCDRCHTLLEQLIQGEKKKCILGNSAYIFLANLLNELENRSQGLNKSLGVEYTKLIGLERPYDKVIHSVRTTQKELLKFNEIGR